MKRILFLLMFLIVNFQESMAQSPNLNDYNLAVFLRDWKASLTNNDGANGLADNRMYLDIKLDTDNQATQLVDLTPGFDNRTLGIPLLGINNNHGVPDQYFYSWVTGQARYEVYYSYFFQRGITGSNGKFDVSALTYDECCNSNYVWNTDDAGKGNLNLLVDFKNGNILQENDVQLDIDNYGDNTFNTTYDSNVYLRYYWRPAHGEYLWDPLQFGVLSTNTTTNHRNALLGNPNFTELNNSNDPYGWEYHDRNSSGWGGYNEFTASREVYYEFVLNEPRDVVISTDNPGTNFDTYLHLISLTNNRNNYTYIEGDDDDGSSTTSYISRRLNPGVYGVMVEGYYSTSTETGAEGQFELSVGSSKVLPVPGVISLNGGILESSKDHCPGNGNIGEVLYNYTLASSIYGSSVAYSWERKDPNHDWFSVNNCYEDEANGCDLGKMESYDWVKFRRKVTAYGAVSYSNEITFNTYTLTNTSGGTITGDHIIPFFQEKPDTLKSLTPGVAYPFLSYSWEQSTNTGVSYAPISGATSSQYIIPQGIGETNPEYRFRRLTHNQCQNSLISYSNVSTIKVITANGNISGYVRDRNNVNGIDGIKVYAKRTSTVSGGVINKLDSAITSNGGNFIIPDLYYGNTANSSSDQATYVVTPYKEGHDFDKNIETVVLSRAIPERALTFRDTTGFTITGNITQECDYCDGATLSLNTDVLKDVIILENQSPGSGSLQDLGIKTDSDGKYSTIKLNSGDYTIKPQFHSHQFAPAQTQVTVGNGNVVSGINFKDTTTHFITVNVAKDCEYYPSVGSAELLFTKIDPIDSKIKLTVNTTINGYAKVRLPAGKYKVQVNSITNLPTSSPNNDLNAGEMVNFLNALPDSVLIRDITDADAIMNLFFHESPVIEVYGLTAPTCDLAETNPNANYTLFKQLEPKTFSVKVFEGKPLKQCPVKDDTLKYASNLQKNNEKLNYLTSNGLSILTLTGGDISTDGGQNYAKPISFTFSDNWNRPATPKVVNAIVTGIKASEGGFTTTSPQIPYLILRDPPGDGSFSFLEQNKTVETTEQISYASAIEKDDWITAKLGFAFETGVGISTSSEIHVSATGEYNYNKRSVNDTVKVHTLTANTTFKTSDNPAVVGSGGDIFVGAATNYKTAIVKNLKYKQATCNFELKDVFMVADSGFATEFIFSENHIKNTLIPQLLQGSNTTANDSTKRALLRQLSVWQQTLDRNEQLKKNATFSRNRSFDGAVGEYTNYVYTENSSTISVEFEIGIDSSVAVEMGAEIAGSGLSGGVTIRLKKEIGGTNATNNIQDRQVGYTLKDDDPGDNFSVDIKTDPVYKTPVFDLVGGTSSCPHEPGSQFRDVFDFYAINPILENQTAGQPIVFDFRLYNSSFIDSDVTRNYYVRFVDGSAPGAKITNEGNPFLVPKVYTLFTENTKPTANAATASFYVGVEKAYGSTPENRWGDIRLQAYDACSSGDPNYIDVVKEVSLVAGYANSCSPIRLSMPENNFKVNGLSDVITIEFKDYLYNALGDADKVRFEYATAGSNTWTSTPAFEFLKADLQNSSFGTQKSINISALPDGDYKFRAVLTCGLQTILSVPVNGTIDRDPPLLFGNQEPADGIYELGDVISIKFNENLQCSALSETNFSLKKVSNNQEVPATLACFGNQLIITPNSSILSPSTERYAASVNNIRDAFGNNNTNSFEWNFGVKQATAPSSPYVATISAGTTQLNEDSPDSLAIIFQLSEKIPHPEVINFSIAGNAEYLSDYTTSFTKTNLGYEGSVKMDSAQLIKTIFLKTKADTQVEPNETVIISLATGGEYGFGTNNSSVILTITNDDVAINDCDNNGVAFNQSNNNVDNTAIAENTYHKLLLESNGKIEAPTTVIFKGEKSITLNPGFEVKSGSVFRAILEDCPNNVAASFVNNTDKARIMNQTDAIKDLLNLPYHLPYEVVDKVGEMELNFAGSTDLLMRINLFTFNGNFVKEIMYNKDLSAKEDLVVVDTKNLQSGAYFLKIEREGQVYFHNLILK
ncbi:Ig-like domain-containing protein [Arcticibacterium luteifluviistationis]|uniref:SbsA Ig-like domain-containing protein n=1 Tax=Arcticibacterium luteifluviistationis TaxID=1784714 RepID=A0A2Z4GE17_9BACT|nr:Ig-like domain-containing protein [Arcticibacterium luteifluviistationis]AWV99400.1 hypothetical protein DJ013_15020 [Arcticibacterium luteifluviistationis]